MNGEFAIETQGLTKRFGETVAVESLDLAVERGEVYGFLGPNGAGKTTTMRMLTTLTRPSEGEARIMGDPVTDRDAVVKHIGYLPETPPLYDELTAREQLEFAAFLNDRDLEAAEARAEGLMERLALTDAADNRISTYSKGMKQKTALIQAVIHGPDVVFLDEPTSGLDPRASYEVRRVIDELADRDTTVFLSTHILSVVEELADRIGVLNRGRLVAEGSPEELKRRAVAGEEGTLEQAFLEVTSNAE